jgi:hypothetical protein
MVNLLLVKDDLVDLEIFERGVNSETIILKDPSMNDVLELIDENVVHIGFVYHYEGFNYMPFLNEIEMLIDESGNPLIDNDNEFCYFNKKFLRFLEEVKSRNENIIFDLLTCNVIHSYFIDELDKLKDKYGFTFRYSTNDKGYGGDWIQESHDISIKDIYFTEEIDKWEHVLNLSMTPSEVATTYPSDFDWDGTTLSLKRDFEWGITTMNTNFITLGDNEIFDGKGFTISLTVTLHYGLFGSSGTSVGTRPIIKNLYGTFNNSNNSYYYNGFILRSGQSFVHIDNCHTSSTNDRYFSYFYGGGIAGGNTGINGNALIENCSSVDMVSAYHYGGDIAGSLNSSSGGEITIKNCFSRNILYYRSAGILAPFSARNSNWRVYIYNCNCIPKSIHSWDMQSLILGYDSGNLIGNIDISNCYSIFNLTVSLQSGISGYLNYGVNIMNCYFIGNLTGSNTSGIAGHSSNKVTVENSYMVGNITGSNSGGIFGPSTTDSSAINCHSIGSNTGSNSGGIFGSICVRGNAIECFHDGIISGNSSGGIFNNNSTDCIAKNCYTTGNITGIDSGGIFGFNPTNCYVENCYALGNVSNPSRSGSLSSISNSNSLFIINSVGKFPLIPDSISPSFDHSRIVNSYTDLNIIFNATDNIYNKLNWEPNIWIGITNNLPRLVNNFIINNNEDLSGSNLSNIDFSNKILRGINLSFTNLSGVNFSGTDISSVNLTGALTGPILNTSGVLLPPNYQLFNNYIINSNISPITKGTILKDFNYIQINDDEITDISLSLFNLNIFSGTLSEKYNDFIKIFNFLKVPSNKIQVKNLNKTGYWVNGENNVNINITKDEYLYLLNVPEENILVNVNNQESFTIRKVNDNYIINDISYNENQIVYINNKFRVITGSFLIESSEVFKEIVNTHNNQTITLKSFNNINVDGSINNSIFTTTDSSVNYLLYSGFRGGLIKFNITGTISGELLIDFNLPNITDTTKTLKLYKIVNNTLVNPINVVYNNIVNKWTTVITELSNFILIDENSPTGLVGGDPFILNLKTNEMVLLPNDWTKVILYQSNKYLVIGYNDLLPPKVLLQMKKLVNRKEIKLTDIVLSIYQFNYLLKIEVIDLENNNKLVLDTFNGNIIENNNVNIEEITTKNGLNSVDKNFYYPKKNFKSFMIHLDKGNYITIKIDNYWIDLNNIKLYSNDFTNITGELIEHNENNKINLM